MAKARSPKSTGSKTKKAVAKKKAPAKKAAVKKKPAAKKTTKKAPSKKQQERKDALDGMTIAELKDLLRANDQKVGGSKGELIALILDCIENGGHPRCPECFIGRLRLQGKRYACPGGYDDDEFVECDFDEAASSLTRPPWRFSSAGLV